MEMARVEFATEVRGEAVSWRREEELGDFTAGRLAG